MAALLLMNELLAAAAELHAPQAAVACVVLLATALFWRSIHSRSFLSGLRPGELQLLRPIESRSPFRHFIVLGIGMGAVLHAEPLVAVSEQHLYPAAVVSAVFTFVALVNWAILSLNFGVAAVGSSNPAHSGFIALSALMRLKSPKSPNAESKESHPAATPPPVAEAQPTPGAAPALHPYQSRLARAAFVALAALMSASWFLDPVAAAAGELRLPWPAVVGTLVVFAMCFYTSVHIFRSFFLPRAPVTAAPPWEGIAVIAAVGVGVAAFFVGAGGSAYGYAPARLSKHG